MTEYTEQTEVPVPEWIATDKQLNDACAKWSSAVYLAVDTEFVRTSTFYPKPGLIQVADDKSCALIDPLEINDWSAFRALMLCPDVVKVFHSCAEDLEVCKRIFDSVPTPLFDTQIAMALSGYGGSVGFQRAVSELLELDIPKEATRTDWLQRPLTSVQMEYATADVFYLFQIYPLLKHRLEKLGRESWVEEECARLVLAASQPDTDYSSAFQKVKSGWKLRPQEQSILQQLAIWREEEARSRDVPRNKVADDPALWNLSRFRARNRDQLYKAGLRANIIKECGKQLLQIIQRAQSLDSEEWPELLQRPLSVEDGNLMKLLKKGVVKKAEALDIPPEMLANKKTLEALIRAPENELPPLLMGWRKTEIGDALLVHLNEIRQ
ncbi:ribonuclease D [Thalassolituus sp. UBA3500]|uniref:ribonuclease D n=1 Tax=Thalassolituus sp. UBA3500 TaxID=1947664 RepID=UPI000C0F0E2D|nr:ribonuclease D [Thalassolituus sp. UBA3500]MBN58823.1 ribonuclease D [Oceanospirillaceae bacterium]